MKDANGMRDTIMDVVGTIGEDVLTVHELTVRHNNYGDPYLWPRCDSGRPGELATEWLRKINCPACLALRDAWKPRRF